MKSSTSRKTSKNKNIDIDVKATDAGEDTQSNYRFQNLCTSLIAFEMYRNKTEYSELFCELYEDVVAIKKNKHFVGIQIKHHDKNYGMMSIISEAISNTLKRFIEHEKNYPKKFDKYIIMSNTEISVEGKKQFEELREYCKERKKEKKEYFEKILNKIAKKNKNTKDEIEKILKKTYTEKVPDRKYIVDHIANNSVGEIKECEGKNIHELKNIVETLADLIYKKSMSVNDSLQEYFSFIENSEIKKIHATINHKRIIHEEIENIINKSETIILLESDINWPENIGSFDLIDTKMSLGGIHDSAIRSMRTLTTNAYNHFFRRQYGEESEDLEIESSEAILKHVIAILDEIDAKSETKARGIGMPFGLKKLEIIDDKIDQILKDRPKDVHQLSPEILKGLLGLRIVECKSQFSNTPEGGFV